MPNNQTLRAIDPTDIPTADRIVEIQRAAYAVEAALIGFDGIPQLTETAEQVRQHEPMCWIGAFLDRTLVGLIAYEETDTEVDIDRLAIDPGVARQGFGRLLVQSVPTNKPAIVSTGAKNEPAVRLYSAEGFEPTDSIEISPGVMLARFRRAATPM